MNRKNIKRYSELIQLPTYEQRFQYLKLMDGKIGEDTFGYDRWLRQKFCKSPEYQALRRRIILRDNGCDLGIRGCEFGEHETVILHHMNPITKEDIVNGSEFAWDPEYLISVSLDTHNAIHYGRETTRKREFITRSKNDTCPWK